MTGSMFGRIAVVPTDDAEHALCADHPELTWFPELPEHADRRQRAERDRQVGEAKAVCERCPIQPQCLQAALDTEPFEDHGILGGFTAKERLKMRKATR